MTKKSGLQTFKNELFEVAVTLEDGQVLFDVEKVAKCLNIGYEKNGSYYVRWNRVNSYLGGTSYKKGDKISSIEVKRLIQNTNTYPPDWLLEECGIKVDYIILSKEQETLKEVVKTLDGLCDYECQFYIDGYKVDLYLPRHKIAIECDEFNHSNRDIEYEIRREEYIRDKLGCKFIRYNPDARQFSFSGLINSILKEIYNN